MKKVLIVSMLIAAISLSACGGSSGSSGSAAQAAAEAAPETSETQTDAGPAPAETGTETTEEEGGASLTAAQQELADKVFAQLQNKEYDAIFADMIYPENSLVKVDDVNNLFLLNLSMDEVEKGVQKQKINETFEDGAIRFEYGLDTTGYTTVLIFENADTPDGYEVRLSGLSGNLFGGNLENTVEETRLVLPSGLTNVVVDGVSLDNYKDDTYFEGTDAATLGFDPADYTAYRVVFPALEYQYVVTDEMVELMENEYGFKVGRTKYAITADSPFGRLTGEVADTDRHLMGYGDHEGRLYQPLDSTAANDMLLSLLQEIFDAANEGHFDVDAYREFFVDGTADEVIEELTGSLDAHFNDNVGTISNLKAEEIHTYTKELKYEVPKVEYVGNGKMDMDIGVHSSFDQNMTYSEDHEDAYNELRLTVQTDGSELKIVEFPEYSGLEYLFNSLGDSFEDE